MFLFLVFLQLLSALILAPVRGVCLGGAWLLVHLHPWDIDYWLLMKLKPYVEAKTLLGHWLRRPYIIVKGRPVLSYEFDGHDQKFYTPEETIEMMAEELARLQDYLQELLEQLKASMQNEQRTYNKLMNALTIIESELTQAGLTQTGRVLVEEMKKDKRPMPTVGEKP